VWGGENRKTRTTKKQIKGVQDIRADEYIEASCRSGSPACDKKRNVEAVLRREAERTDGENLVHDSPDGFLHCTRK
jgi:hypothetical protein